MKSIKTISILIALVITIALFAPAGSQVVVIPSKEDRILEKLDRVLANQKEMRAAIDRITKTLEPREKDAGKAARIGAERGE